MKKTKLPVAWLIFLAAVCALAATVLQSARKTEQEFPMAGKNVSQLDTEQILTHIRKAQRCGKNTAFYVNGDNFELQLTADFDEAYSREKRRRNLVDFADLEHLALKLLTRSPFPCVNKRT